MARVSGWVATLMLALVCAAMTMQAHAQPFINATIQSISYSASTTRIRPGGKFRLQGRMKITSFGNADRVYCAFKNLNWNVARTAWGTPEETSSPKLKVDDYYRSKYIKPTTTFEKVYWEFYKATSADIVGKEWVLTVRGVRLDPTTAANQMVWRWYCEDIWDNSTTGLPITNSYPIGKDKQMTIAISGPPQKVKSAPRGGPVTRKKATGK